MTLLYIYIYICVCFYVVLKGLLGLCPFSGGWQTKVLWLQWPKVAAKTLEKQRTDFWQAHPWILTAKPIQNSWNHPKSKKKTQMLNLAIQKNSKSRAIFFAGPKSDRRWSSSLGYSLSTVEPRRKLSVRSLDIAAEPVGWGVGRRLVKVTWAHREKVTKQLLEGIKFCHVSCDFSNFLWFEPLPFPIKYSKKCTSFLPKNQKDNKGHSNWREVF